MRVIVILAVLALSGVAHADRQIWNAAFVQVRQEPRGVAVWFDLHGRRRADSLLALSRFGLGYAFAPSFVVHAGGANIKTIVDEGDDRQEWRVWQHAIWTHAAGIAKYQVRGRFEQRFASGDGIGHRVRIMARAQLSPWADVPAQLVVWDEVFLGINETEWGQPRGFDQNRGFVGVGTDTAVSGLRIEGGYMNILLRGPNDVTSDHALAVNLFVVLPI